ncbi:MAG: phosphoenolpyruvate carboxylase [Alphaproteobacteria bacterium]|nr:phosphoenolpyruvate carboxylase [Alphaproteobacteria bacterium]
MTLAIPEKLERLAELDRLIDQDPLFNPVGQLGFEISRDLESGDLGLDEVIDAVHALEGEALGQRAARVGRFWGPVGEDANFSRIDALLEGPGEESFEAFKARWERPRLGCVMTGHPTFLLSRAGYGALASAIGGEAVDFTEVARAEAKARAVTIDEEHEAAMAALGRACEAQGAIVARLISHARKSWPDAWRGLVPQPFAFATWVGYDMDGRTDIPWTTSLHLRLVEKALQLERYAATLAGLTLAAAAPLARRLAEAADHAREMAQAFAEPLDTPDALSRAANRLTGSDPRALVSLAPVLKDLGALIGAAPEEEAAALVALRAQMASFGLGIGQVHFRINASQLHNAIRRRLGEGADVANRSALAKLREALPRLKPLSANFASLAIEATTAVRQFLAMTQILKHVDADRPIRLLIAETEQPMTVLIALYFARLFGIEAKVEICPLFETERALEHASRFIATLLSEKPFKDYVRSTGRLTIQTGFSDAGRFMGQIPAALAIERLQGALARAMEREGLAGVEALVFNTHGESMGRGAHPGSPRERFLYPLSPWARAQFSSRGIRLAKEVSFQGGDGFLLFATRPLALAVLTRALEVELTPPTREELADSFYEADLDISLDFYRGLRDYQAARLKEAAYHRTLTAFGLALLPSTGSRRSRRQSEISSGQDASLRRIRAIPHNAILQQLGYPVNIVAGMGAALAPFGEAFVELHQRSARARMLLRLADMCLAISSVKSLMAYGRLYDSAFWAARTYRAADGELRAASVSLAERLQNDDRFTAFRRLATELRIDSLKLHHVLELVGLLGPARPEPGAELNVQLLHALRLALIQHIFLRASEMPTFSRRNDLSRDDILEMILSLRVPEAVAVLREAYPVDTPDLKSFSVDEPGEYPDHTGPEYAEIRARYIDPLDEAYRGVLAVTRAIAHYFGAFG